VSELIPNSATTTDGIRVQVTPMFLPAHSSPRENQYLFAYTIKISNIGEETAQLLSRHWIITDADGKVKEVRGPGVVGNQPVLEPGTSYEYTSYCPLETNVGSMQGTYTMVRPDGELFEAHIAPFTLAVPNALN
jgi:ApaG protein